MRHPILLATALVVCPVAGVAQVRPPPGPPAEMQQYAFLIGEWQLSMTSKRPGAPTRFPGTWKAWWAADGYVIEDEFAILGPDGSAVVRGRTYRTYSADQGEWVMKYLNLYDGSWHDITGRQVGDEIHIVQTGVGRDGRPYITRMQYYDITPNSFRWRSQRSVDGGTTWIDDWLTIEATRIPSSRTAGSGG